MTLCQMTELTNVNFHRTMAVTNNVQLPTDVDGLNHTKEIFKLFGVLERFSGLP